MLGRKLGTYEQQYGKEKALSIRDKQSKRRVEKIMGGEIKFEGDYFWSKKNSKNLYYRSSDELIAYQMLECNIHVVKYEVEVIRIPYYWSDGSIHRYIVDLLVYYDDGSKQLIEVKMKWAVEGDELTKLKIEAGKKYALENGIKFSVWTEKELRR